MKSQIELLIENKTKNKNENMTIRLHRDVCDLAEKIEQERDELKAKLARIEREANNVIYFDDNSDYPSALWTILIVCNEKYNGMYMDELEYIETKEEE